MITCQCDETFATYDEAWEHVRKYGHCASPACYGGEGEGPCYRWDH